MRENKKCNIPHAPSTGLSGTLKNAGLNYLEGLEVKYGAFFVYDCHSTLDTFRPYSVLNEGYSDKKQQQQKKNRCSSYRKDGHLNQGQAKAAHMQQSL
jgi:hypothetical protein